MSPKFVVANLSSQTLRGLRQLCEALNLNEKFHFYLVILNVYGALKKSSSFRTLRKLHELCEAFNPNYTSRFHGEQFIQDFTTTLVMHQARLILPLHLHSLVESAVSGTRTRRNTNPNGTEANAAGRSGNARALRKQSKCGMIQERERGIGQIPRKFAKSEEFAGVAHSAEQLRGRRAS